MFALRLTFVKSCWCRIGCAARFGFILILLAVSVSPRVVAAQSSNEAETAVVFYADAKVEAAIWPSLAEVFRSEAAEESREYPLPALFEPMLASSLGTGAEYADIIEVRLIGRCDIAEQAYRPLAPGPLGWVVRASGEIQPFIYVDCVRLAQYLGPAALGMNEGQRRTAMARAISRIVIHEWIHIDTQSVRHEGRGIRQAELSDQDLIHDPVGSSGSPGGR
jgi:hypothetical protein